MSTVAILDLLNGPQGDHGKGAEAPGGTDTVELRNAHRAPLLPSRPEEIQD